MNYQQTLDYLFSQLPMYQRIGKAAYKANLNNTIALCNVLGNPQNEFKSIHIAGTNGKGSVAHMLSSILQEEGYTVGLYTSPHLKDFRERVKINGTPIPEEEVIAFVDKYKSDFEYIQPSFFEMTVGLAFFYFARQGVDIALVETGLGGRLDSTNIITPLISIITNIGLDHTQFLGESLEQIAFEKAGIIKPNIPVVIGETHANTKEVFVQKAEEKDAEILFADKAITQHHFTSDLKGNYQEKNIKTVIIATHVLKAKGFDISYEVISKGLQHVVSNTGLMGRWQIISKQPLTICDVAHNKEGLQEVLAQIHQTCYKKLHLVFGLVNDKSPDSMLAILPHDAIYYFCKADIPRGLDAEELKEAATKLGLKGDAYPSVKSAYQQAIRNANDKDLIFVGGSSFVVAEVL